MNQKVKGRLEQLITQGENLLEKGIGIGIFPDLIKMYYGI